MILLYCLNFKRLSVFLGFKSWDPEDSGIDIHSELSSITEKASLGEEGANGGNLFIFLRSTSFIKLFYFLKTELQSPKYEMWEG